MKVSALPERHRGFVDDGAVNSEVASELPGGAKVTSVMTREAVVRGSVDAGRILERI